MKMEKIKIIFFGTPEFAAYILKVLLENKFNVVAVFTQPDKKVGRKQHVACSPVKELAAEKGIKVFQPENLRESNLAGGIKNIGSDLFVVAAYGKIMPKAVLEIPKFGAINVHASLLPKYRGASPVQCAILAGEKKTGITLMQMNERMDEGDIMAQETFAIGEEVTADILLKKLSRLGANMLLKNVPTWLSGEIKPISQDGDKATYCKPIRREDGRIDWNIPAEEIFRKWRAYFPWPGIFTILKIKGNPKRLKLIEIEPIRNVDTGEKPGKIVKYNQAVAVQTKKGLIVPKIIQLEGRKEMKIAEFLQGFAGVIGKNLD